MHQNVPKWRWLDPSGLMYALVRASVYWLTKNFLKSSSAFLQPDLRLWFEPGISHRRFPPFYADLFPFHHTPGRWRWQNPRSRPRAEFPARGRTPYRCPCNAGRHSPPTRSSPAFHSALSFYLLMQHQRYWKPSQKYLLSQSLCWDLVSTPRNT